MSEVGDQDEGVSLCPLGLTPVEEQVYQFLVDRPGIDVSEVAGGLAIQRAEARRVIAVLEASGLVTRAGGKREPVAPVPPRLALEPLIRERQQQLDKARVAARRLEEVFHRAADRMRTVDFIEVISGPAAVFRRVEQLQRMTSRALLEFSQPPYAVAPGEQTALLEAIRRGVEYRVVYHPAALEHPGILGELLHLAKDGCDTRVHPGVPMKLLIGDRRFGLLPLRLEEPGSVEGALFLHPSSLLEALTLLWEAVWDQATPLDVESPDGRPEGLSNDEERLAMMLLAGLKGSTIARQLGVGVSTAERRIRRLIRKLNANNRFQAGYMLARRRMAPRPSGTESSRQSEPPGPPIERGLTAKNGESRGNGRAARPTSSGTASSTEVQYARCKLAPVSFTEGNPAKPLTFRRPRGWLS